MGPGLQPQRCLLHLYSAICTASEALFFSNHLYSAPSQGRLWQCRLCCEHDGFAITAGTQPFRPTRCDCWNCQPSEVLLWWMGLEWLSLEVNESEWMDGWMDFTSFIILTFEFVCWQVLKETFKTIIWNNYHIFIITRGRI